MTHKEFNELLRTEKGKEIIKDVVSELFSHLKKEHDNEN